MKTGDRVLYAGRREKYQGLRGTVDATGCLVPNGIWVVFDDGQSGVFSHASDFKVLDAVSRLAELAEGDDKERRDDG